MAPSTEGATCDWCSEPAVFMFEILKKIKGGWIGSQMYVYSCGEHRETAFRAYGYGQIRQVKSGG